MPDDPAFIKHTLAGVFDRAAPRYTEVPDFHHFGALIVADAAIEPGHAVLDVGCGRGATLLPAARAAGGKATGVDLSMGMLRNTRAAAAQGVSFARMDAESLALRSASQDRLLCCFVMQFFPDAARAFAEFHRVLRPGARMVIASWAPLGPEWDWFDELRRSHGAMFSLKTQQPGTADLGGWLEQGGFKGVEVLARSADMTYADEEAWWHVHWSVSARAGLERMAPDRLAALEAAVQERLAPFQRPDGFHVHVTANIAVGTRP